VAGESDLDRMARYEPSAFLLDSTARWSEGESRVPISWSVARRAVAMGRRIILAAGLTPDNVAAAIGVVGPYAVDVASGVEAVPGRKDHDKVRQFVRAARAAAGPGESRP
jgi:phosphoribosylanthranilate isomerase